MVSCVDQNGQEQLTLTPLCTASAFYEVTFVFIAFLFTRIGHNSGGAFYRSHERSGKTKAPLVTENRSNGCGKNLSHCFNSVLSEFLTALKMDDFPILRPLVVVVCRENEKNCYFHVDYSRKAGYASITHDYLGH